MINYKEREHIAYDAETITCDICNKTFDCLLDVMETQEFHYIDFIGGYGSVFGDDTHFKMDICQRCLKKLVGDYIYMETDDGWIKAKGE